MATMITDECINCGACEPECPNTAIYQGGVEWDGTDGGKHPTLSNEIFFIVPEKCTECVGFFDHEACAAVCPVDCCIPNPDIPESEAVLLERAAQLHPDKSFGTDFPSRFRAGAAEPVASAAPTQAVAAAAPQAATSALVVSAEDELAAAVPPLEQYPIPLVCFRCAGEFEVEFQYVKPGTVLHCPHCFGSFVPNSAMYQGISRRLARFYGSWDQSLAEFRARRESELERFEASQRSALDALASDVKSIGKKSELAGAPTRNRGFFG